MNRLQQLVLAASLTVASVSAFAQPGGRFDRDHDHDRGPRAESVVDARQHQQADRIRDGAASGRLTPRETRVLLRQQQDIRQAERAALADGRFSFRERQELDRLLDRADRDIARQLHDRQGRRG